MRYIIEHNTEDLNKTLIIISWEWENREVIEFTIDWDIDFKKEYNLIK